MGWTSKNYHRKATHTTLTAKQALEFLENENYGFQFAAFHFVPAKDKYSHNECYMIMRHIQKMKTFICCTIIDIKREEIYWKDIEESEGPAYYNCPEKFFEFVKAPNSYAEKWREECRKNENAFIPIGEVA